MKSFKTFDGDEGQVMASEPLLKTQQLAEAFGVSVSTIKRWVDGEEIRAKRTVGKHRLVPLSEAVRFAHRQGLPLERLNALHRQASSAIPAIDDTLRESLITLLREGRNREARLLIRSVFAAGFGGVAISDELIRPVMERIGHGWLVGAIEVYQEHEATQTVAAALAEQVEKLSRNDAPATPLALGAAPEGDPYTLALTLGELVLREAGWNVRNLGANLPLHSLASAVIDHHPRLIFLSVNHLADSSRFADEYSNFYETAAAYDVAVMLGGRALVPELRDRLMYTAIGGRIAHLAEFARRLWPIPEASSGTEISSRLTGV